MSRRTEPPVVAEPEERRAVAVGEISPIGANVQEAAMPVERIGIDGQPRPEGAGTAMQARIAIITGSGSSRRSG